MGKLDFSYRAKKFWGDGFSDFFSGDIFKSCNEETHSIPWELSDEKNRRRAFETVFIDEDTCFYTEDGVSDDDFLRETSKYCNYYTSKGEFESDFGEECKKHGHTGNHNRGSDGCGARGFQAKCVRVGFNANPKACCLRDYEGSGNKDLRNAFGDNQYRKTCDFEYRNVVSPSCRDQIEDLCSGKESLYYQGNWDDLWLPNKRININDSSDFNNRIYFSTNDDYYDNEQPENSFSKRNEPVYLTAPCMNAIIRNMVPSDTNGINIPEVAVGSVDPIGFEWSRKVFSNMLDKYVEDYGSPVVNIDDASKKAINNEAESHIYSICRKNPSLCTNFLEKECKNYTNEDMATNPNAVKWCGCYMRDEEYDKYINLFQINKECTPFCSRAGIPLVSPDGLMKMECLENLCLMDDQVIRYSQSSGHVDFNQICNSCGSSYVNVGTKEVRSNIGKYRSSDLTENLDTHVNGGQTIGTVGGFLLGAELGGPIGAGIGASVGNRLGNLLPNFGFDIPAGQLQRTATINQSTYTDAKQSSTQVLTNKCQCIALNTTINIIDSELQGVNVGQNCGTANCYKEILIGGESKIVPYPCSVGKDFVADDDLINDDNDKLSADIRRNNSNKKLISMLITIVLAGIFLMILGFFGSFHYKRAKTYFKEKMGPIRKNASRAGTKQL